MKQKIQFQSIVAETLLIPLYNRAKESRRQDPILRDPLAESLVDSIDYDFSRLDGAPLSELGCVVRGWYFDNAVSRLIATSSKNVVVVNVGCGLDTRYQRNEVKDSETVFYDMDLPEVIDLRRQLIPESPNNPYIAASLLETDWLDTLRAKHPDSAFIFVIEGVLMYFSDEQVKSFLGNVANRFAGGEIWFDVSGKKAAKHKPDALRKHEAQIRSGIDDGHEVEQMVPSLSLIEQANYMQFFRSRWGFFYGQIIGRMPRLCQKFSSLLGYKIGAKP